MASRPIPFVQGVSRLGIDVGGVLTLADTDGAAEGATEAAPGERGAGLSVEMQRRPPTDDCVAVVAALVRLFGAEHTFVVSKCGVHMQRATVVWLNQHDFFGRTGVLPGHVAFCTNRSGIEGEGVALSWAPLDPPEDARLEELCAATERTAAEVSGWFGVSAQAQSSVTT